MLMSREEAERFLTEVLGLPPEYTKSEEVSLSLLDAIIWNFQQRIPFQSVTSCAVPQDQRHLPSWDEIKESCFSGRGGLCYHLNVFMKVLLDALGYDASLASGDVNELNDHVTVVVSHLHGAGSHHLVEVGSGYPTFRAIPLDFAEESPEYVSGFLRHKFVRKQDSLIWYQEPRREFRPIPDAHLTTDGWYRFVELSPFAPRAVDFFETSMTKTFTNQSESIFLQVPRAVIYPAGKLLAMRGKVHIVENDEGRVDRTDIRTLENLLERYKELFPQFQVPTIEDALRHSDVDI